MKLAVSSMISKIDNFSAKNLGLSVKDLMEKSGIVVADAVRTRVKGGESVIVLAGKGNNGGDGYAAAVSLMDEYDLLVIDVLGKGQKNEAGRYFMELYKSRGGRVEMYEPTEELHHLIKTSACVIDAVFGTGFVGEMPESIRPLAITVREAVGTRKIAIDVPLGINPDDGSVSSDFVISVEATVALSFIKPGIISYPARAFVGEIIYDSLGLPEKEIDENFNFKYHMVDTDFVKGVLPKREENSNKGTFGKLLLITGSEKYRGAAHLSAEAALRGGVGLVTFAGCEQLLSELSIKYPEMIFHKTSSVSQISDEEIKTLCTLSQKHTATVIGSGSDNTEGLLKLTLDLLATEGGILILDADAINSLSSLGEKGIIAIKEAKRNVIITPHPLEFARFIGDEVANVQLHRLEKAEKFAKENNAIVVLKGASTIVTDGENVYINSTGSSALSKAGSGDVLAGFMGAMCAQKSMSDALAATLSVYLHGAAGDALANKYSSYGVTPSDLPKEIACQIAHIFNEEC